MLVIEEKTNTEHIIKSFWDKLIYSTLLHVSALQGHLQGELLILVEITKLHSYMPKTTDLLHAV